MKHLGTAGESFHFIQSHICLVSGKYSGLRFDEPFFYNRPPTAARYVGSLLVALETKISEYRELAVKILFGSFSFFPPTVVSFHMPLDS